ncbi:MAG: hydrogenase [Deltaproteobacteria bacterium]|nr:hydrogenase [Deltaproteobacteria bacterium]
MRPLFDPLLVLVLLLNFFMLGTSRLRAVIRGSALQGVVLGGVTLLAHGHWTIEVIAVAASAALVKGFVIPKLLYKATRDVAIHREVEPLVGLVPSLLLGAVGTGAALIFSLSLPLAPEHKGSLLLPASLSTLLTGFLILTTRRKAITQVVGYLVLENGIFIMGLMLLGAMPFLVEVGVLLDLFVGVFVMGIIINHIGREFATLDTDRLDRLKE